MPLIVTCSCGKSFQAKDEFAGRTAKCTACGTVLTIAGPLIQKIPSHQQPVHDEDVISPEAAAIMLQRQLQRHADSRFIKKMMLVGGGLALAIFAGGVYYMSTRETEVPPKTAAGGEDSLPATVPAQVTPVTVPEESYAFDKSVIGRTHNQPVKWAGKVVSGMSDDGSTIVFLNTETLPSGSTSTYRARFKLKQKLATPIPSGTDIVFEGTVVPKGMTQTNEFRAKDDGSRRVDAIYTLTLADATIISVGAATTSAVAVTAPAPHVDPNAPVDEIEKFIRMAAETKDRHHRFNAKVFKPDDPRLTFTDVVRPNPANGPKMMFIKTDPVDSMDDLEGGPPPTKETDLIEARMLLDNDLVGDGLYMEGDSKHAMFYVFLADCPTISREIQSKYGDAKKILKSGSCFLHFYGRMIVIVLADGRVHGVVRKVTDKKVVK